MPSGGWEKWGADGGLAQSLRTEPGAGPCGPTLPHSARDRLGRPLAHGAQGWVCRWRGGGGVVVVLRPRLTLIEPGGWDVLPARHGSLGMLGIWKVGVRQEEERVNGGCGEAARALLKTEPVQSNVLEQDAWEI